MREPAHNRRHVDDGTCRRVLQVGMVVRVTAAASALVGEALGFAVVEAQPMLELDDADLRISAIP